MSLLAPGGYVPLPGPLADAWRSALKAAKSGSPGAKHDAVRRIVEQLNAAATGAPPLPADPMASGEEMTPGGAIGMLAILGDKDAAFAQAKAYLKRDSYADSSFLFWPNLAEFPARSAIHAAGGPDWAGRLLAHQRQMAGLLHRSRLCPTTARRKRTSSVRTGDELVFRRSPYSTTALLFLSGSPVRWIF